MQGKRVLITGGAGLIGSHIADLVAGEGPEEIVVLDNFVRGRLSNLDTAKRLCPVRIVEGDIRDMDTVTRVTTGMDIVFHQAAIRITQCAEEPRLAFDVLAGGTFNVLEACVRNNVGKVVAASSASVLGLAETFPTSENHHPYDNRTIYGAAKTFNEGLLRSFAEMYGLKYVALRYFNVYGPRMDVFGVYTEVLIRWMERIAAGRAPIIMGDGLQTMDFVDARDIARANILAAKSKVTDEVFNVASGVETSLVELAKLLLEVMKSDLTPEYAPARKVNAVPRRLADTRKAKEKLGFEARIRLRQGLEDLVGWWRAETASTESELA
ncbi:NAD-dependent epimerase/dehydratase family protein [Pelagibacterium sp. H642]|uniref:NAD-dependent epimerase/dehydratase family protein n=1 Tax=Pelagibacterium sp. H642 TaxID=1881069 RepID=UPI0028157DC4|nr:NAD-dependent epimerase/dehydratase family protein [Pelagibacterium sp. H642]WMT92836.1 NAD-dependent epimerase/dehydratase family protein [Pelagibacterium sp. H642]